MSLFGQTKRHTPTSKPRRSPLPIFTSDAEVEKFSLTGAGAVASSSGLGKYFTVLLLPLPRLPLRPSSSSDSPIVNGNGSYSTKPYNPHRPRRYIRVWLPIPPRLYARIPRFNTAARAVILLLILVAFGIFLLGFRKARGGRNTWSPPFVDPNTLVLTPDEVAMIWEWEILSGHHPSLHDIPENIPLASKLYNPAIPSSLLPAVPSLTPLIAYQQRTPNALKTQQIGVGPERRYLSPWDSAEPRPGFPPRPTPGSVLDLDLVLDKCDLTTNKYVRDCLEFIRIGGGLDNGRRVRRGNYLGTYKQTFLEESVPLPKLEWKPRPPASSVRPPHLSRTDLQLSPPNPVAAVHNFKSPCDPLHPRLFHMFWAGPFSDKPYMAVMSFLFTQNLGLDLPAGQAQTDIVKGSCRPQFWVWINPGPAAAVPNPSAKRDMYEQLATNPWSAPFLHERFRDVVKFKMWNTTDQLDGIPELKDHWRTMQIFNSGGFTYKQPSNAAPTTRAAEDEPNLGEIIADAETTTTEAPIMKKGKNGLFEKVGSSSESDYDRLSVILSDMARFVLTYRYGGIYLDADTIFLRDWEELWNYRGQFAYRWSWHQKYNTAVLKLHKGSALSTFLFKSALENGLDFHPMTVSRYLKDAGLDKLLFRIPDALFDPAWLNMERYQRERPPFPYFPEFSYFFSNDKFDAAGPQPLGFDGFFRGAFSYHFHNFWWLPFDPSRNWPDLGPRFSRGEKLLREASRSAAAAQLSATVVAGVVIDADDADNVVSRNGVDDGVTNREDMDDELDLSWSTVLKRTFEAYLRAERPNMYGEWLEW